MKTIIKILLVVISTLFIYGCPYDSAVPLSDENEVKLSSQMLNNRYIGKTSDGVMTEIVFKKKNENEYLAEVLRYEKDGEKESFLPCKSFKVGNVKLLQFKSGDKFYFVKQILSGYTSHFWYMNSDFVMNNSSKSLSSNEIGDLIIKHSTDTNLFIGKSTFVRFDATAVKAKEYCGFFLKEEYKAIEMLNSIYCEKKIKPRMETYYKLKTQVDQSIEKINRISRFDGSSEMREASLKLMYSYKTLIETELFELLSMMKNKKGTSDFKDRKLQLESIIKEKNINAKSEFNIKLDKWKNKYGFTY